MYSTIAVTLFASAALVAGHGRVDQIVIGGQRYVGADNWDSPSNKNSPVRQFPSDLGFVKYNTVTSSMDIACGNAGYKGTPVVAKAPAGSTIDVRWDGDQGKDGNQWPHCEGTHVAYMAPCTNGDCRTFNPSNAKWFKIHEAGYDPNSSPRTCPDGHLAWPRQGRWAQNLAFEDDSWYHVKIPSSIKSGQYLLRHELVSMHAAQSADNNGGAQYYPSCIQLEVINGGNAEPQGVPATSIYTVKDGIVNIYKENNFSYKVPGPALFKDDGSAPAPAKVTPTSTKPVTTSSKPPAAAAQTSKAATTSAVYVPKPTSKTCKPKKVKRDLHDETRELYDRALAGAEARRAHAGHVKRSF